MADIRYTATVSGHEIALEFDTTLVVVNRLRLQVDGVEVDRSRVVYGERDLHTTLADGTAIEVRVHSGMVGEATRVQLRNPDGAWQDMLARAR